MKNKAFKTKLLTVLLTLCMVLSLVPLSVFAATPATETADFTVGQGREAITLLNQYKTGTAESLWDNTAKTLTLWGVDFTTTAQTAVKLPAGSTIVLKDGTTNTIQSGEVTLRVSGDYSNEAYVNALDAVGSLTIQGGTAGSGTLSVFAGKLKNSGDGWVYSSGISVDGDFTVKGGRVTARGGCAESDGSCFSFGVKMDSDTKNKALLVTGGTLTAIADEAYELEEGGTKRASFSRGVEMFRGNVIVSGSGKLRAESVEEMAEATVMSNGLYISAGNLTVANSAEVAVAGAYAAYISGGSLRLDGGSLTAVSTQTADDNGNLGCAIYMDLNKQVADSGSITVSGGTLETVNGDIRMSTIGATGNQSLFTVTGGTIVNRGQLYGPKKLDISGGTMQTQGIEAEALTLSDGSLTIREPVRKNPNYDNLLVRPALDVNTLTVSGGTLDAAWDWGEFTPIVFPVNTYYGYADSLVEMTGSGSTATFTGGTTTLDTGKAGNTALLIKGTLTIGDGMAETGADSSHHQLGTAPVKIAAAAASTAITTVDVANVKLDYQPGDAPRATAAVAAADQGKYRIADEWWQELNENDEPVAIWHSDGGIYSTLPTITAFESGKKYVYSILLLPERGYDFAREVAATVNGSTVTAVPGTDGYLSLPNVKTITPTAASHTHSYGTAWKYDDTNHWHECECGDKADIAAHSASEWIVDTAATETADGAKHKECTVCKKVLETAPIPATGSTHTHSYGTDWKYDGTNHWHECECGDKADTAAHSFQWVIDKAATKEATGIKHEECTVCGAKRSENTVIDKLPDGGNTGNTGSGDNNTDKPGKDDYTKSPQTGDSSNLIGWLAALFVSGGVLTVLGIASRKKSKNALK